MSNLAVHRILRSREDAGGVRSRVKFGDGEVKPPLDPSKRYYYRTSLTVMAAFPIAR